jgi:hypothetical protein
MAVFSSRHGGVLRRPQIEAEDVGGFAVEFRIVALLDPSIGVLFRCVIAWPTSSASICGRRSTPPCLDEKTAIQALDRLRFPSYRSHLDVPNATGTSYYRHGTLSLYTALDTATGRVHGKTATRHTSRPPTWFTFYSS